jgi:hypothetical protein
MNRSENTGRFDPVLLLIFALAATAGALIVKQTSTWSVMPDELIYTQMGRSVSQTILPIPMLQGVFTRAFQMAYPTLIAPLVGGAPMPHVYSWIAVINAVLMASACIPAYLLTSWMTGSRGAARLVALSISLTPWLILSSSVLPDSMAFAACTWGVYAIARTAGPGERAWRGDLIALAALLMAFVVRNQLILLLGVWFGAVICAQAAASWAGSTAASGSGARLRRAAADVLRLPLARPIPIFVFIATALTVLLRPEWILGYYTSVATSIGNDVSQQFNPLKELANHASILALGAGVLPAVLGLPWLLAALGRPASARENTTAVTIALALLGTLLVATNFDMRFDPSDRVIERYVFCAAPLLMVAMAGFFKHPPKTLAGFALPALLATLLLGVTTPYGLDSKLNRSLNQVFSPTQMTLIDWQWLADKLHTTIFAMLILLTLLACAGVWWAVNNGRASAARNAAFVIVTLVLAQATLSNVPSTIREQNRVAVQAYGHRTKAQKRWIEVATGDRPWALAYSKRSLTMKPLKTGKALESRELWRDTVFYNRGLTSIYQPFGDATDLSTPIPGVTYDVTPDLGTGVVTRSAEDDSRFILLARSDPHWAPQPTGRTVARGKFVLYPVGQRIRAAWAIYGLTPDGFIPPGGAKVRIWAPQDATGVKTVELKIRVTGADPRTVTVGAIMQPGGAVTMPLARGAKKSLVSEVSYEVRDGSLAVDDVRVRRGRGAR